jgi:hypothetical protein
LRQKLPRSVDILVGGSCPIVGRKAVQGITAMSSFAMLHGYVAGWRAEHL